MKAILSLSLFLAAFHVIPAANSQPRWVDGKENGLPPHAVRGGFTPGNDLYVCRVQNEDGVHVGRLDRGRCYIGLRGKEAVSGRFQVLTDRSDVEWVFHGLDLPQGAVQGGRTPAGPLYICRVFYQNGTHLGKVWKRQCLIPWGGKEVAATPYQILRASRVSWRPAGQGMLPLGVVGGGQVQGGEMYVCRARFMDGVHPGKLWNGKCIIPWDGREISRDDYEVLVSPGAAHWVRAAENQLPANCLDAGGTGDIPICVCRGAYLKGLLVGKTHKGRCLIGWDGKEIALKRFEVLVGQAPYQAWDPQLLRMRPPGQARPSGRGPGGGKDRMQ